MNEIKILHVVLYIMLASQGVEILEGPDGGKWGPIPQQL
jgi:hypothetical protein